MDSSLGNEERKMSKPIQVPTHYSNSLKSNNFYPNNSPNKFMNRVHYRLRNLYQIPKEDKRKTE